METEEERAARVQRTHDLIAKAQAMAREIGPTGRSLADELIADRRREVRREAAKDGRLSKRYRTPTKAQK